LHHVHERCVRQHSVSGATPLEIAMPFQTRIPSNTMERSQGCQKQHLLSPLSLFARGSSFSEDAYCPFALDALRQSLELLRELFLDEPVSHELVRTMRKKHGQDDPFTPQTSTQCSLMDDCPIFLSKAAAEGDPGMGLRNDTSRKPCQKLRQIASVLKCTSCIPAWIRG